MIRTAPFNLLGWSISILIVYFILQLLLTFAFGLMGVSLSPPLSMFTWFAVSAALGYSLYRRCQPATADMVLLQGLACLYVLLISTAITLRTDGEFIITNFSKGVMVVGILFAVGGLGFALSKVIHGKSQL